MALRNVVKTTYIFKKREGTTDEDFSKRFIEHGKDVVPFMLKYNVITYNQVSEIKAISLLHVYVRHARYFEQLSGHYSGILMVQIAKY